MHERVALVGGALEIDSAPGRGTTVSATLPAMTAGAGELGASDLRSVG